MRRENMREEDIRGNEREVDERRGERGDSGERSR